MQGLVRFGLLVVCCFFGFFFFLFSKTKLVEAFKCKLICIYKGSLICSACYIIDKQQRLHTFITQLDGKYE